MPAYIPLVPGVKTGLPREFDPESVSADHAYQNLRMRALVRDRFTCRGCGFQTKPDKSAASTTLAASGYLEVHHADNNHRHNDLENLISLCPFCHSIQHLGISASQGRIALIIMPWLTQPQINLLSNLVSVAMAREGDTLPAAARELYQRLSELHHLVPEVYGEDAADASVMAGALAYLQKNYPDLYGKRQNGLRHLRILPRLEAYPKAISWWSGHAWLPGAEWEKAWYGISEQA